MTGFNKKNISQNKHGSALAYALVIMAAVSIILVSILQYISAQMKFSLNRGHREEAFQIAEAGIYYYRWYLAHNTAGKTVQQIRDFWQNGNPYGVNTTYEDEYSDPGGGALGKYQIEVVAPDADSTIVMVKSTGWTYAEPGAKRIIQARLRRPSWSEYAVSANDNMRFGTGTTVYGKIHSNQGIRFDGTAYNIVSSSVDKYDDPDHNGANEFGVHTHVNAPPGSGVNDNFRTQEAPPTSPVPTRTDVFKAGRQFPVATVDFGSLLSDLDYMKSQSQISGRGKYFDNAGYGRRIILKSSGTYDICTVNSYDTDTNGISDYVGVVTGASGSYASKNGNSCIVSSCCIGSDCPWIRSSNHNRGRCESLKNYDIISNGIIFVEDNVWLEGTLDSKKLTIVANNTSSGAQANVFLGNNNLLYAHTDGREILGIIAQNDVEIIQNSQDLLTVSGALLAKNGRVGRNHYGSEDHRNTITVNGSIATNLRYGFAYTDGTGYTNRILNFDNNLLYYPPPYFPTGSEYAIDLWDEL